MLTLQIDTKYWNLQEQSDQAGYDMWVYEGSTRNPNDQGYTVYIDQDIGTVI